MRIVSVGRDSVSTVREGHGTVSIIRQAGDPVAAAPAVSWAIGQLGAALDAKGARMIDIPGNPPAGGFMAEPGAGGFTIGVGGSRTAAMRKTLASSAISIPDQGDSFCLVPAGRVGPSSAVPGDRDAGPGLVAAAPDGRGLVYAMLELADRVEHAADPFAALRLDQAIAGRPANEVRSVARLFTSELHDLAWYRDAGFWRRYLSMLAAQRINRFSLTLGLGYNFPWHVTDGYFFFAYPFLVDVAGYRVRIPGMPPHERELNLEMLRFASSQAAARGLDFQLGLWNHASAWFESPNARHTVEGLPPDRHAPYCRDALRDVLDACPDIGGLTLRIHGESGIPERSWDFWSTVLDGVTRSGRRVGIDLHAKGLDQRMLEIALATGLPVTVSPKWAGEHQGLPYHQAAMRELDRNRVDEAALGGGKGRFMTVSEGSRPFTRYSYADFLTEDRRHGVVFRIWAGTQRLLLSGDPAMAASIGRHASLAGSQGVEWCEPLSFMGREGSAEQEGSARGGRRDGYADASLGAADDWEKYAHAYRLFGRLSYDPAAAPEDWRRSVRSDHGPAATAAEAALASASRILPLVTSAHHPSASNNYYWPELYTDIAIAADDGSVATHYYDTPEPKRFGTVGALDPEIFSCPAEAVAEALAGEPSGRYSPLDIAAWLERLAGEAAGQLAILEAEIAGPAAAASRRLMVDVAIQEAIGRFFAAKLRAAVHYELFTRTGSGPAITAAARQCRSARSAWADAAAHASSVYVDDLTFGPEPWLRGTWADRLPAIAADLQALERLAQACEPLPSGLAHDPEVAVDPELAAVIAMLTSHPDASAVTHQPPDGFRRGEAIPVELVARGAARDEVSRVSLRYRRLDQSDAYRQAEMHTRAEQGRWTSEVPAGYADSPYPVQYFFVLRGRGGNAGMYPGLGEDLCGQPYFVVRSAPAARPKVLPVQM
jgi:hypothetical protein